MNIRHNEILRDKLAAEYVLGTLKGGARRRFEAWLPDDAALRRAVSEWQDHLCPLAELSVAAAPPARVWRAIEQRIAAQSARTKNGVPAGWRHSLDFWRWLGMGSTTIAAVLLAVVLVRQPTTEMAGLTYVALLADNQANTTMLVTADVKRQQLTVKVLAPQNLRADQSLELWALPKEGAPRSLGLLAADGSVTLTLPAAFSPESIPTLAVSLEQKGGSPNPQAPSGPVLFKGAVVAI